MTDGSIRASDNDRERVVTALRDAFTEGRLTLDEFEERTSAAYAARTWGDLRALTDDLPAPPVLGVQQQGAQQQEQQRQEQLRQQEQQRLDSGLAGQLDTNLPPLPPMSQVRADMMRTTPRRQRPFGRLLPVVFIWAVIAAAAGASHLAVVLAVVFVAVLGIRALSGTRW
jgi:hypothetical protein